MTNQLKNLSRKKWSFVSSGKSLLVTNFMALFASGVMAQGHLHTFGFNLNCDTIGTHFSMRTWNNEGETPDFLLSGYTNSMELVSGGDPDSNFSCLPQSIPFHARFSYNWGTTVTQNAVRYYNDLVQVGSTSYVFTKAFAAFENSYPTVRTQTKDEATNGYNVVLELSNLITSDYYGYVIANLDISTDTYRSALRFVYDSNTDILPPDAGLPFAFAKWQSGALESNYILYPRSKGNALYFGFKYQFYQVIVYGNNIGQVNYFQTSFSHRFGCTAVAMGNKWLISAGSFDLISDQTDSQFLTANNFYPVVQMIESSSFNFKQFKHELSSQLNTPPFYSVDRIQFLGSLDKAVGIGIPRDQDFNPLILTDLGTGLVALYSIHDTSKPIERMVSVWFVNLSVPGRPNIYFKVHEMTEKDGVLSLAFSVSSDAANLDKLGGAIDNLIISVQHNSNFQVFPSTQIKNSGIWENVETQPIQTSMNALSSVNSANFQTAGFGAMCVAFNSIYCELIPGMSVFKKWKNENYFYAVNTKHLYTYTSASSDDGLLSGRPTNSEGQQILIASGNQVIAVGVTLKSSLSIYDASAAIPRTVTSDGNSGNNVYINSKIYTLSSVFVVFDILPQPTLVTHLNCFPIAFSDDVKVVNSALTTQSFYQVKKDQANTIAVSFHSQMYAILNTNTMGTLVCTGAGCHVDCFRIFTWSLKDQTTNQVYPYFKYSNSLIARFYLGNTQKMAIGFYEYDLIIDFMQGMTQLTWTSAVALNLDIGLQFSSIGSWYGKTEIELLAVKAFYIDSSGNFRISVDGVTQTSIPNGLSLVETTDCTANDAFTVIQPLTMDEGLTYPLDFGQNQLISNSNWDQNTQKINIALLNSDLSFNKLITWSTDFKFEFSLALGPQTRIAETVKFLVFHKSCILYKALVPISETYYFINNVLTTVSPLVLDVTVTVVKCEDHLVTAKVEEKKFYLKKGKTEDGQQQVTLLNETDLLSLFSTPSIALCSIKKWYLTSTTTTTELTASDSVYSQTKQAERSTGLGPLVIGTLSGVEEVDIEFRIGIKQKFSVAEFWLDNPATLTIKVKLGCFEESYLKGTPASTMTDNQYFYSFSSNVLELIFPKRESGNEDIVFTLTEFWNFQTDNSLCGAYRVTTYSNSDLFIQTSESSPTSLAINPTYADLATGLIDPKIRVSYGVNELPQVYIHAETQGIDGDNQSVTVQLKHRYCDDQPSLLSSEAVKIELDYSSIGQTTEKVLDDYFLLTHSKTLCEGSVFDISSISSSVSASTAPASITADNKLQVTPNQSGSFEFYVIMTATKSLNKAAKKFVLTLTSESPPTLNPPTLDLPSSTQEIKVTIGTDGSLVEDPVYTYTSPQAVHPSGMEIVMSVLMNPSLDYATVSVTKDKEVKLELQRNKVTADQPFRILVTLGDSEVVNGAAKSMLFGIQFEDQSVQVQQAQVQTQEIENLASQDQESGQTENQSVEPKIYVFGEVVEEDQIYEYTESQGSGEGERDSGSDAQRKIEGQKKATEFRRIKAAGFVAYRGIGQSFPGLDPSQIAALSAAQNSQPDLPDPEFWIHPLDSVGDLTIDFTQDMLHPKQIVLETYNKILKFTHVSYFDGSRTVGKFVQEHEIKQERLLEEVEEEEEALSFDIKVNKHDATQMAFEVKFNRPYSISTGNEKDQLIVEFLEMSMFRSAQTLKPISLRSFEKAKPDVSLSISPQIDRKKKELIDSTVEQGGSLFKSVGSSNFIISLLLGVSMHSLWSTIRATKFIIIVFLIRLSVPGHTHVFFQGCMNVAKQDFFDGSELYESLFGFHTTTPLSAEFETMGMESKNFMYNSGSFFFFVIGIFLFVLSRNCINWVATKFPKYKKARQIGMWASQNEFISDLKYAQTKLFLEGFFEIFICCLLQMVAFFEVKTGQVQLPFFFSSKSDILNSALAITYSLLAISFPVWVYNKLMNKYDGKATRKEKKYLLALHEEIQNKTKLQQLYNLFFVLRRLLVAVILTLLTQVPFFQGVLFLVLNICQYIYLFILMPLNTVGENRNELFNEMCIYFFSLLIISIMNTAISSEAKDLLGWLMVWVAAGNIVINLSIIVNSTFQDLIHSKLKLQAQLKVDKLLKERVQNRKRIFELLAGNSADLITQLQLEEYTVFIREWSKERRWILRNGIPLADFEEEELYQELVEKLQYFKVQWHIKLSKALDRAAHMKATNIIIQGQPETQEQEKFVNQFKSDKSLREMKRDLQTSVFGKFQKKKQQTTQVQMEKIMEEPELENQNSLMIYDQDSIRNNLANQVKQEFKNTNLLAGFQERYLLDNRGVKQNIDQIQTFVNMKDLEQNLKAEIETVLEKERNNYLEKDTSMETQLEMVNQLRQRKDILYDIESSDSEQDLAAELVQCFASETVLKNFTDGQAPRAMQNGGVNDFIQAAFQVLIHQETLVRFFIQKPKEHESLHILLQYMILECYQSTPEFAKNKKITVDISNAKHALSYYFKQEKPNQAQEALKLLIQLLQGELEHEDDNMDSLIGQVFITEFHLKIYCPEGHEVNRKNIHRKVLNLEANQNIPHYLKEIVESKSCHVMCARCQNSQLNPQALGYSKTFIKRLPETLIFTWPDSVVKKEIKLESEIHVKDKVYMLSGVIVLNGSDYQSFFKSYGRDSQWTRYTAGKSQHAEQSELDQVGNPEIVVYTLQNKQI